jgi:dihydroorotase-like cyclic amidohydrolase
LDAPDNAEIIDANGRWLLPAGIDLHCELDNAEDLVNATKDALSGGTTTVGIATFIALISTVLDRECCKSGQ